MKKAEVEIGMRVFRERTVISRTSSDNCWHYGVITSESFEVISPRMRRGLWKVNVLFDNGKEVPVPLNLLKEIKNED